MATNKIAPKWYTKDQAIMISLGANPKLYWIDAPVQSIVSYPQSQVMYQAQPQVTYQTQPQVAYQTQPQVMYQTQPQVTYQQPQVNMSLPPVGELGSNSETYFSGNDDSEDEEEDHEDESED